jgi:type II secretory pathway component PulJ
MDSIAHGAIRYLTAKQQTATHLQALALRDAGLEEAGAALLHELRRALMAGTRPVVTVTTAVL